MPDWTFFRRKGADPIGAGTCRRLAPGCGGFAQLGLSGASRMTARYSCLRIAAVVTLLYFAGHTAGAPWTPVVGPEQLPVLEAMKNQSFEVEGFQRTYWDFYFGFGVIVSAFLLVQSVVLWHVGSLAKTDALRVRPIVAAFLFWSRSSSTQSWRGSISLWFQW